MKNWNLTKNVRIATKALNDFGLEGDFKILTSSFKKLKDGSMNFTAITEDGKMSFGLDSKGKVQRTGFLDS